MFGRLFTAWSSENLGNDIHREPCIGEPFTDTTRSPVKIGMDHGGTTQLVKGVVMFVVVGFGGPVDANYAKRSADFGT